jgi:hypothetical protein
MGASGMTEEIFARSGAPESYISTPAALIRADWEKYGRVVRAIGAKLDRARDAAAALLRVTGASGGGRVCNSSLRQPPMPTERRAVGRSGATQPHSPHIPLLSFY